MIVGREEEEEEEEEEEDDSLANGLLALGDNFFFFSFRSISSSDICVNLGDFDRDFFFATFGNFTPHGASCLTKYQTIYLSEYL